MRKLKFSSLLAAMLSLLSLAPAARAADTNSPAKPDAKNETKLIRPEQAQKLIADKKVLVLDVRTPEEFASGHIAGATNIDFRDKDFQAKIAKLDKSQAYLVNCASGARSAKACVAMEDLHFPTLYNLRGGIAAWKEAGLPVEK